MTIQGCTKFTHPMRSVRSLIAAVLSKIAGKSLTNIESLPDELLFEILVQLPPQDLLKGASLVCRRWYRIINSPDFVHANLQYSPPGLVIQYWCGNLHSIFVAMQQGRIKISEWNYEFKNYSMGSCNGFIMDNNSLGSDPSIYVLNPTTGQRYALPPISVKGVIDSCAVMAYAAASKEYKVVLTYLYYPATSVKFFAIRTVGVDRCWRHIDTEHVDSIKVLICSPLVTGGFIHWIESRSGNRVLTLNVETEIFTSTHVPQGYEKRLKYYLSTGTCLTMVVACSKLSWEVWELKQEESGEWMKMSKIDVADQKRRIKELVPDYSSILKPVGWLNYGEVFVLHASNPSRLFFLYNVRTQQMHSFELNHKFCYPRFLFHRNSLVSF